MGLAPPAFVDETGQPLPEHIQDALRAMLPRARREFATLRDETIFTDVMEAAGRRVVEAERRLGPLNDGLHGYCWAAVRSVAVSRLRRMREGLNHATLEVPDNLGSESSASSSHGSPETIEREILLREIFAMLSPEERRLALLKKAGFSSAEIGRRRGKSRESVDMMYSRVRAKIRAALEPGAQLPRRQSLKAIGGGGDREK